MDRRVHVLDSVVSAIGETPLVALRRLGRDLNGTILAKLEYLNPGFSKKDRIARQIIEDAEADGRLQPGQAVVELTSGNTGTGLAIVCGIKGYPFVAVMSRGNSRERARMMAALGAEVVLVDQAPGSTPGQVSGEDLALVEAETVRIVEARGGFRADQFRLAGNARAHFLHTGPEILRQTGGAFDLFCDFVGTGGSFAGCAAAFKAHRSAIRCFVVEPEGAAALAGQPITNPGHRIQGGGYSMTSLPLVDAAHVDGYLTVTDGKAIAWARRLAREEGIFAGFSSGANVAAAAALLAGEYQGQTAVVMMCDSGLKYLSTDLWA
ncbi:MAG TPA: cysteine synthase family protein [Candidatus Baltobacteraceae bacterium]|nr:cysteine synthase family protein [Candidatus Baltobacteraceae bacterium]